MARRPRLFAPGLLYHVIARGNQRQPTFLTAEDYQAYLGRLGTYQKRYDVILYAYCLMPNHVHLLLQTSEAPLAKFMQGVQQSYTQRFNLAHDKVGHVFQSRYKAIICESDEYLAALVRYIHLNPVRAGLVDDPEKYPYSGHRAYVRADGRIGDGSVRVEPRPVLDVLGGPAAYRRFVLATVAAGREDRYYRTEDQQILGGSGFAQRIRQQAAQPAGHLPRKALNTALAELASRLDLDPGTLRSPDRSQPVATARAIVSFILVRRLGYRVADVAAALARDAATTTVIVSRLAIRMESSDAIAAEVARLTRDV
jgi:REP-associated tyrosine transposase